MSPPNTQPAKPQPAVKKQEMRSGNEGSLIAAVINIFGDTRYRIRLYCTLNTELSQVSGLNLQLQLQHRHSGNKDEQETHSHPGTCHISQYCHGLCVGFNLIDLLRTLNKKGRGKEGEKTTVQ